MSAGGTAYLEGNWGPVEKEISAEGLRVEGELPRELSGTFLRIGPNPQFPPMGRYHWFDGDGMVHAVHLGGGAASYRNRYVETKGYRLEKEAGKALWSGLMEPPQLDHPHGMWKNVANTAMVRHAGKLLALWEGGTPHELRLPSLDTVGAYTFEDRFSSAFTAHPKVDAKTGEMVFFGYSLIEQPFVRYGVVGKGGEVVHTAGVELEVPVMMHDFAITAHYSIIMDLPFTFRFERMMEGKSPFAFEGDRPSRFGIMPRHGEGRQVRWFEASPCFIFHTFNAWEEGCEVVLLASRLPSTNVMGGAALPNAEGGARLCRFRFNLETGAVKEEILDDTPADFPRVNEDLMGYKTRFGYAVSLKADSKMPYVDGVVKYDFEGVGAERCVFGEGQFGGEMVFAPRPGGKSEDDGWLLGFVHDEKAGESSLWVLDAREPGRGAVARVLIPQRVPYGFHAAWLAG